MIYSDDHIHDALEKVANIGRVKAFMRQGMSPTAAVKKAYPSWNSAQVRALVRQLVGLK